MAFHDSSNRTEWLVWLLACLFCAEFSVGEEFTISDQPETTEQPSGTSNQEAEDGQESGGQESGGQAQPRPRTTPSRRPNPFASPQAQARQRTARSRLTRAPYMFGDLFGTNWANLDTFDSVCYINGTSTVCESIGGQITAPIPCPGAVSLKVSENNRAFTSNRAFFMYNHFRNALQVVQNPVNGPMNVDSSNVDVATFGLERVFGDGQWSAEIRMPFTGNVDLSGPNFWGDAGRVGNLGVILKRVVRQSERSATAIGMGVSAPTGKDVHLIIPSNNTTFTLNNQTTHLLPYIGTLSAPDDTFFYHAFMQLDIPANGDRIDLAGAGGSASGIVNPQTLLFLDFGAGQWHYQNGNGPGINGIASIVEIHYTTALEDADMYTGPASYNSPQFGNAANRLDVLNATIGLHINVGRRIGLRFGAVLPMKSGDNRFFDSEGQFQVVVQ